MNSHLCKKQRQHSVNNTSFGGQHPRATYYTILNLCNHLFKHWCLQNIEEAEKEIVQPGMTHVVVGRGKQQSTPGCTLGPRCIETRCLTEGVEECQRPGPEDGMGTISMTKDHLLTLCFPALHEMLMSD